jgi:hypothetical protein
MPSSARLVPALAVLALLALSPAATAKVADPRNCEGPPNLVGSISGAVLPSCASGGAACRGTRFVIRDFNNSPIAGGEVVLDFSNTSIRLLGDERPGTTVDCAARTIRRLSDPQGVVVFAPRFVGTSAGADVVVTANHVPIALLRAHSTDLDGNGVTDLWDMTSVVHDYVMQVQGAASDFDPCAPGSTGRTTLTDFTIFVQEYLRSAPAGSMCP